MAKIIDYRNSLGRFVNPHKPKVGKLHREAKYNTRMVCLVCGSDFVAGRVTAKYCSNKCRSLAYYRRKHQDRAIQISEVIAGLPCDPKAVHYVRQRLGDEIALDVIEAIFAAFEKGLAVGKAQRR